MTPEPSREGGVGDDRAMDAQTQAELTRLREWLTHRHGTDYGANEAQMLAVIERAQAKRRALGYGSVQVMAADMLREGARGPDDA